MDSFIKILVLVLIYAILDKFKRAKLAISNGVDIVIELPFIYSNSSANLFSYGALNILDKIGVVDILSFGSEIGSTTILQDLYKSDSEWNIAILRYFNPVGAHESGLIGEDPKGVPANLMPYIQKVAAGKLKELSVFGNDYDTKDGTGVRDYIHVVDLAIGHIKALDKLRKDKAGMHIYNLGTGVGYSVLDMVNAFEKANNIKVPYKIAPRRAGDIAMCYSDPKKAKEELGFEATRTLEDMCRDSWNFEKNHE